MRRRQACGVGQADNTAIKRLSDMGFKVTVTTGGLALEDLPLISRAISDPMSLSRGVAFAMRIFGKAARQFKQLHCPTVGLGGYAVEQNFARHL